MNFIFTSTFSGGMIARSARQSGVRVSIKEISLEDAITAATLSDTRSAVGHPATAALMTSILGTEVPFERIALALTPEQDTALIVFQLEQALFKRLNEGEVLSFEQLKEANDNGFLTWNLVQVS